jgi:hypothetical protein
MGMLLLLIPYSRVISATIMNLRLPTRPSIAIDHLHLLQGAEISIAGAGDARLMIVDACSAQSI